MINKPVSVKVDNDTSGVPKGDAPYTFVYSSNNPACVTFDNVTGICHFDGTHYVASTNINYLNPSCFGTSLITCVITDANGCSVTKSPLVINDPCNMQASISNNGEFVFVATVTGGLPNYTFQWTYDTSLWEKTPSDNVVDDNYLSLKLKPSGPTPISTPISCVITDSQGCTKSVSFAYSFCKPTAKDVRVGLSCQHIPQCANSVTAYTNLNLVKAISTCANQTIDWSKLQFSGLPDICIINNNDGTISIGSTTTTPSTKVINWAAMTTSGILSNYGKIIISITNCTEKQPLSGVPTSIQLTAEDPVSDVKYIPVDVRVAGTPDWSTFTFTNTPSFGTVTFNADREIEYTIADLTTTPSIPDIIKWSLNDYSGNQINITDVVNRDVIAVPTTVTEVICNTCGETTDPQDLLANDTGDIDRSTAEIVLNDPDIVITKDSNNNFIFTSLPGAGFNNLNSYRVANTQGAYAPAQNFFVSVACVGDNPNPTKDLTCEVSKSFNILDQFTNVNAFNTVFTETSTITPSYTTQGGTIGGGTGAVDFTGINVGTYTFEFTAEGTAACHALGFDDKGTLTVINGEAPFITITSATNNGNGTSTYTWDYVNLTGVLTITLNGSVPSYSSSPLYSAGSGTLTLFNVSGTNTLIIQSNTVCNTTVSDSDNSLII